jgi:dolichyl-phosphate-mannose-protein mannosyltransferase
MWPRVLEAASAWPRRRTLALLFAIGLAVNLSYVLGFNGVLRISSDASGYDARGFELAQGRGFLNEGGLQPRREPGMIVFLGGMYAMFGHDFRAVRIVQAIMTATFALFTFLIAGRMARAGLLPASAPIVAAALTVVYPGFVIYSGVLMRETLLTFFFLISLVFLAGFVVTGRLKEAAWYGAFTGLGALVDSRLMYFPVFLGLVSFVVAREWRRTMAFVAVTCGVALLVVLPWTIHNYVVYGRFVLLATAPAKGMWLATNPQGIEEWDWTREPLKSLLALPSEERDRVLTRLAFENVRDHPVHYARTCVQRFFRLWLGGGHSNVNPLMERSLAAAVTARDWGYAAVKSAFVAVNLVYVLGGFAGMAVYLRRFGLRGCGHLAAFIAYLSILHSLHVSSPRYQIPAMPILIIFLAYLSTGVFGPDSSVRRARSA